MPTRRDVIMSAGLLLAGSVSGTWPAGAASADLSFDEAILMYYRSCARQIDEAEASGNWSVVVPTARGSLSRFYRIPMCIDAVEDEPVLTERREMLRQAFYRLWKRWQDGSVEWRLRAVSDSRLYGHARTWLHRDTPGVYDALAARAWTFPEYTARGLDLLAMMCRTFGDNGGVRCGNEADDVEVRMRHRLACEYKALVRRYWTKRQRAIGGSAAGLTTEGVQALIAKEAWQAGAQGVLRHVRQVERRYEELSHVLAT